MLFAITDHHTDAIIVNRQQLYICIKHIKSLKYALIAVDGTISSNYMY